MTNHNAPMNIHISIFFLECNKNEIQKYTKSVNLRIKKYYNPRMGREDTA